MTRTLFAAALVLALASPAMAKDDSCRDAAVEVELNYTSAPDYIAADTVIEHDCIRRGTVVLLVPLEDAGPRWRYWQTFPAERGAVTVWTVLLKPIRVLAILRHVDVES